MAEHRKGSALLEDELHGASSSSEIDELLPGMKSGIHCADVLEELGYAATSSPARCKEILALFGKLSVEEVARIVGMVARTHTGLDARLGVVDSFNFCMKVDSGASESPEAVNSWNLDHLLSAINELVPEMNWYSVVEHLDFEGFYLPDQKAFLTLMIFFTKASPEPFPTFVFWDRIWNNREGQLSFLSHASTSSPEIISFASSPRLQLPIEGLHGHKSSIGTPNQAWLSLDLLDILCQLGESGHITEVRSILEYPIKQCPEILLIGIAQIKTELNLVQSEVISTLLPSYLSNNSNSSSVLHLLWPINREVIISSMVEMHAKDPTAISRILDICQDLKVLSTVLENSPFSFSIDLAALASRREYLNLEKWLQDGITLHKDSLFQACLDFLREKTLLESKTDGSTISSSRPTPVINLSLETTAVFFKVLQSNASQLKSPELAEEMKRVYASAVRANPRLLTIASSEQNSSEVFSSDIEEEANSYFQRIYVGELNIEEVVEMLKRFNKSTVQREQEIFACMIQSLFDEYRFFPRYPDKELRITAFLFGSIIKHQLVSSLTLGIALRCVLESLKKHVDSKMFSFGITALELFKERLFEWPQYCNHILQISHLRESHPEIIEYVEKTLSQTPDSTSTKVSEATPSPQNSTQAPQSPEVKETEKNETEPTQPSKDVTDSSETVDNTSEPQTVSLPTAETPNISKPDAPKPKAQKVEMLRSTKTSATRPAQHTGFGTALNIETLVAAAEKRESPVEVPSSEIQDKVAFIINNISMSNLDTKAADMVELLNNKYFPWFAQYIVMKRSSIEPNFHDLYIKFLDKMGSKELVKEIVKATYENCKVLLRSELIKVSSEERSLLKNLGSWLGKLTIGRNQALRAKEIDPKSLIIEAYEKGLMIAIIPFTSKILEPCQSSLAYQPPNPWTMGILGLLTEIYNLPNLKMNLKFDIEVLFKNLSVDMKDVKATQLLKGRTREMEGNPDFSNKDISANILPSPPLEQARVPPTTEPSPPLSQPTIPTPIPEPLQQEVEDKVPSVDRTTIPLSSASPAPSFSFLQVSQSLPNLSSYIVLNPKVSYLGPQLSRYVTSAMDRAIREIIQPVVDRSVTIACMTTRELVMKDFALESEEIRTHKAANLMVSSLAGSLAHVTCKEPLRVAMASHLRNLLQGNSLISDMDATVNLITNDNLDLGCAVIEKAATEKAIREIEESLTPALVIRRKQREALGSAFFDASVYSQGNLARLPESLRPKLGRLSPAQQRVYEDYARLSWQSQATAPQHPSTSNIQSQSVSTSTLSSFQAGRTSIGALNQTSFPRGMSTQPSLPQAMPPVRETETEKIPPLQMTGSFSAPLSMPPDVPKTSQQELFPSTITMENVSATSETPTPEGQISPSTETMLSIPDALEKITLLIQQLDSSIMKYPQMRFSGLPNDHEAKSFVKEIIKTINQCPNRDEIAIGVAQKIFKHLYDDASNIMHISTFLSLLEGIREVCVRVIKEVTNWWISLEDEKKYGNREIAFTLVQSDLLFLPELSFHLSNAIDNGRNVIATDFSIHLLRSCIQERIANPLEFTSVIEILSKIAQRPGAPESLQQLIEIVRTTNLKDDKSKHLKEKGLPIRAPISKDESKLPPKDLFSPIPINFSEQALQLFDSWMNIYESPNNNEKSHTFYITQFYQSGVLKNDETVEWFFRLITEVVVNHSVSETLAYGPPQTSQTLQYIALDAYAKLIVLIVKFYVDPNSVAPSAKINLLDKILQSIVKIIHRDADDKKTNFNARPYFRLFISLITDFTLPDPAYEFSNLQVLNVFYIAFHSLQPIRLPGFSFSWLELISHRLFMPKLLLASGQKGWPLFQKLLVALFKYLEIYLRNAELCDPVRLLYKGTLRVLLVLLHDFPEFLCDYHFHFCDVIPPSCIQMRNLILSAFPRNMRLPDPFTPNLKVDLLPEISQSPKISSDYDLILKTKGLKNDLDEYLMNRQPPTFLSDLKQRLLLSQQESVLFGSKYNAPLINALVLSVGIRGISLLQSKNSQQGAVSAVNAPLSSSAPMDIFQRLITDLDSEGRYLFLNAIANQLRYPNNQTHYFSCVLLWLFAEASQEIIQEQITRVLLERLIVNRPHPWGLLITFIELIKNPRYNFWSHGFTRCAPEIEKLFESVARSCMGSPVAKRAIEDESGSTATMIPTPSTETPNNQ